MTSWLRARPAFRRLWAAATVSQVGDWLSFVAVSALALEAGGGALGLALVLAAHALPAAVLSPVAGALVDRADRRRVMIGADLLAALVTAAMAAVAMAGAVVAVQLLLLARSAITAATPPAETAAVRRLVRPDELVRANAILAVTWSAAFVAGMALGGVAAMLGPALALALNAGTFLMAAALRVGLPAMPPATSPVAGAAPGRGVVAAATGPRHGPALATLLRETPRDTVAALRRAAGVARARCCKAPLDARWRRGVDRPQPRRRRARAVRRGRAVVRRPAGGARRRHRARPGAGEPARAARRQRGGAGLGGARRHAGRDPGAGRGAVAVGAGGGGARVGHGRRHQLAEDALSHVALQRHAPRTRSSAGWRRSTSCW
ncbi:MAG: MFS transporter [Kofleriaceae bacterium]|nr:MFS transporter [Kofleriaceae bacterium]